MSSVFHLAPADVPSEAMAPVYPSKNRGSFGSVMYDSNQATGDAAQVRLGSNCFAVLLP